jgi:acetyltransferase
MGGVQVELLGDVAFRLPPVSDVDAREMLDEIRASRLLDGFRGSPVVDRTALVEMLTKISALTDVIPELVELDLNPIKVRKPGMSSIVVDGRMRVRRRHGHGTSNGA